MTTIPSPSNPIPSPESLDSIASGYRAAQILFTANRLRLFPTLGKKACSAEHLALILNTSERGMRILCNALVSIGLLEKEKKNYRNSAIALEYLIPEQPKSQVAMMYHANTLYERWGKLFYAVKTGKRVPDEEIDFRLRGDEQSFAEAMADIGKLSARQMVEAMDVSCIHRMLDMGGGPGIYSIEFARANPQLQATVFDSEETLRVTHANIREAGLSDRVLTRAGDALQDEYGDGYDFILLSNFVHIFSYEQNQEVMTKCARALEPGGKLCIKDFFIEPDRTSPTWGALFAVNMLVNTDEGNCYTFEEVQQWLTHAGFVVDSVSKLTPQSSIVIAKKAE